MASMPPQPAQRRSSQPQTSASANSADHSAQNNSSTASTTSEDSQLVILSPPAETASASAQTSAPPPLHRSDTDVKKCWICFADETEDTPESSAWRSPCPCALVAHEDCLLDWIADMESPNARKRAIVPPKILCPQCKSEIHLARPWNPLVEGVKALQRVSARVTTPAMILAGSSSVYYAFTVHGVHSIMTIFGQADGWRILRPFLLPSGSHDILHLNDAIADLKQHWRLRLGLPLITPMLMLSRTTLADSVLPVLPILFLATQGDSHRPLDPTSWPPSASLTISLLPYMRGFYNAYYNRFWAPHERRWLRQIQPKLGQADDINDGNAGNADNDDNDDDDLDAQEGVLEIRMEQNLWNFDGGNVERDIEEEDDDGQGVQRPVAADHQEGEQAHPLNDPPLQDEPLEHVDIPRHPPAPIQAVPVQQPPPPAAAAPAANNNARRLQMSTTGLAEKMLGALFFPTIASLSGELLRLVLPASWTVPPSWTLFNRARETGIMQRRWGRSIVGGCLFVVLKDAIMLYVRWKMAQQHRSRRILNYDKKRKRVVR